MGEEIFLCSFINPGSVQIGGIAIESIRESVARTRLIIQHVNEMLAMYKIYCERSQRLEDMRRFRVIHGLYIAEQSKSADEIADEECVETRTIYRDIDAAVERLTALIFGIDGLDLIKK